MDAVWLNDEYLTLRVSFLLGGAALEVADVFGSGKAATRYFWWGVGQLLLRVKGAGAGARSKKKAQQQAVFCEAGMQHAAGTCWTGVLCVCLLCAGC